MSVNLDLMIRTKLGEAYAMSPWTEDKLDEMLQLIEDYAEQRYNADREKVIKKNIGPGIAVLLGGLLIGSLITFFLVKKEWYVLLYVIDIVFIFVLFCSLSLVLCH